MLLPNRKLTKIPMQKIIQILDVGTTYCQRVLSMIVFLFFSHFVAVNVTGNLSQSYVSLE